MYSLYKPLKQTASFCTRSCYVFTSYLIRCVTSRFICIFPDSQPSLHGQHRPATGRRRGLLRCALLRGVGLAQGIVHVRNELARWFALAKAIDPFTPARHRHCQIGKRGTDLSCDLGCVSLSFPAVVGLIENYSRVFSGTGIARGGRVWGQSRAGVTWGVTFELWRLDLEETVTIDLWWALWGLSLRWK